MYVIKRSEILSFAVYEMAFTVQGATAYPYL